MVGAQQGEGALISRGKTVGYYNTLGGSYGLQAGAQTFSSVLFMMSKSAVEYLDKSDGWEVGVGPSVVLVDQGMATSMTTTTTGADVYSFTFGQKGLMAGAGLQGTKVTRISK